MEEIAKKGYTEAMRVNWSPSGIPIDRPRTKPEQVPENVGGTGSKAAKEAIDRAADLEALRMQLMVMDAAAIVRAILSGAVPLDFLTELIRREELNRQKAEEVLAGLREENDKHEAIRAIEQALAAGAPVTYKRPKSNTC
jgi:hypothetical protein